MNKKQQQKRAKKLFRGMLTCMVVVTMMPGQTAFAEVLKERFESSATGSRADGGAELLFGVLPAQETKVSGVVWNDVNKDGTKDTNEPLIANYPMSLCDAQGEEVVRVFTDKEGAYLFEGVTPGTYKVKLIPETVEEVDYVLPSPLLAKTQEVDNKFVKDFTSEIPLAYTEIFDVEAGTITKDLDAGLSVANEGSMREGGLASEALPMPFAAPFSPEPRAEGEEFKFEVTVDSTDKTFLVPTSGYLGGSMNKSYNWDIKWGDSASGTYTQANSSNVFSAPGISHTYTSAGTYAITITPSGGSSSDAWLGSFGFTVASSTGCNKAVNRAKVTKVLSPITPLMMRTQAQIDSQSASRNEWYATFSKCTNLTMGDDFTFDASAWNGITVTGDYFANSMFSGCSGAAFTMNSIFNLPSNITTAGDYFASSMFSGCSGAAFTMGSVFNLPSNVTTVSINFASNMFSSCSGAAFAMNQVFNLPPNITTTDTGFAFGIFSGCSGASFTMNSIFNFPQNITTADHNFAKELFSGCSGAAFTMNSVFNFPQNITAAYTNLAYQMFNGCSGVAFTMNDIFNLPQSITVGDTNFAYQMFNGCSGVAFTMNSVFDLPQGITVVDINFANSMFSGCSGAAFTMNSVFNFPQDITAVGVNFASNMFSGCSNTNFQINEIFKFPTFLNQANLDTSNNFYQVFTGVVAQQARTAVSIINSPSGKDPLLDYYPSVSRETFSAAFKDRVYLHSNWGGIAGYTLTYDLNEGTEGTGPSYGRAESGATLTLDSLTIPQHASVGGADVVFVGWSAVANSTIYSKDDTLDPGLIISSVILAADTSVYAVWADDKNGNGKPDYQEGKFQITYDNNSGIGGPGIVTGLIPDTYTFHTPAPTHAAASDHKVIIFAGWSDTQYSVLSKDAATPDLLSNITITDADRQVYAVWADDKNGNGTPDYQETKYQITYDTNSGIGGPGIVTGLIPDTYTFHTPAPTHAAASDTKPVIFVGWSDTQYSVLSKDAATPDLLSAVVITDTNVHVYAVWADDKNNNGTPDYEDTKYQITYDNNSGVGGPGIVTDLISDTYVFHTPAPTHAVASDNKPVLFVGWSTNTYAVLAKESVAPSLLDDITIVNANVEVYAVWADDKNGNGKPDYQEGKFQITYDNNSGIGGPGIVTGLIPDTYTFHTPTPTHAAASDHKVIIFAGWSDTQYGILDKDASTPDLLSNITITDADRQVYAVWADDKNGNGTPDYQETKYQITYDTNSGIGGPGIVTGLIPDTYTFHTPAPTHAAASDTKPVIFVGWSDTQYSVLSKDAATPDLLSAVVITDTNVHVYAVWADDKNNNGTPDYEDTKYQITYDNNSGVGGPGIVTDLISDTYVFHTPAPTHAVASDNKPVLFVGWSTNTYAVLAKESVAPSLLDDITIVNANVEVYAVWADDKNGNGKPDYQEGKFQITYDNNSGIGGPGIVTGLIPDTYTFHTPTPTHAAASDHKVIIFAGWSDTQYGILDKDASTPDLLSNITITDADRQVYAVWADDKNGNGTPDYQETKFQITYDNNSGVGGPGTVTGLIPDTYTFHTPAPTHAAASDTKPVIFVGWSTTQYSVLSKDAATPDLLSAVVIADTNVQVYAVWADDKNNNGVPDYEDSTYRTVTEHYVDRTGNTLQANTRVSILEGYSYTGNAAPILTSEGYAYGGAVYSAPSTSSPSYVAGGALPTLSSVMSDTEVWYVYGSDTNKDGIEDVQVTRQWVFISGGVYVRVPGATKDTQTFNVGDTFTLNQADTPAPTTPSGFTYAGYLTDQDALTTTPHTGSPSLPITVADGNRTISYVYDADPYWVAYHVVDRQNNEISTLTAPAAEVDKIWGDTYGPVVAPLGTNEGKIYIGWKEGITGALQASAITGTVTNNMDIYLVYGTDTNRDGKEDVDVTRHALGTDGTPLTTKHDPLTKTVNLENSPYAESQAGVTQNGWSYVGWNTTGSTTTYASGNPDIALAADTNVDVYYLYERVSYAITEHYVDRFGEQIKPDATLTKTYGESYTGAAAPVITGYLYAGSTSSAPTQALPSLVSGKTLPAIPAITQDTSVWYVYGADRVTSSGNSGTDGIEDLEVQCKWVDADGNNIAVSLPQKSVYVDIASVFNLAYASGVTIPAGWDYLGYKLNRGALNRLALPTPRSDPSFPIELATPLVKTVEYVFARSLCLVTVTHVDTQGNSIGSCDTTINALYGEEVSYSAPSIADYTYAYWTLDGASQGDSQPNLTNVTSAHAIQLVYKATVKPDPGPTPTPDNSDFMKRPHSKNVSAGETLGYTFSGFGNAWGFNLEHFTLTDKPDKGLDFVSANLPAFTKGEGVTYHVAYFTNQSGKRTLHSNVSAAQAFSFQAPVLDAGEYITAVTLEFGTVPSGFAVGDTFTLYFKVWDTPPAQTLTNTGILSYKAGDEYKEFVSGGNGDGSTAITIGGWFAQTGDTTTTLPWAVLATLSATLLAVLMAGRRYSRARKKQVYVKK